MASSILYMGILTRLAGNPLVVNGTSSFGLFQDEKARETFFLLATKRLAGQGPAVCGARVVLCELALHTLARALEGDRDRYRSGVIRHSAAAAPSAHSRTSACSLVCFAKTYHRKPRAQLDRAERAYAALRSTRLRVLERLDDSADVHMSRTPPDRAEWAPPARPMLQSRCFEPRDGHQSLARP